MRWLGFRFRRGAHTLAAVIMRNCYRYLLLTCVLCTLGCGGASTTERTAGSCTEYANMGSMAAGRPLTREEISAFLAVLRRLPGQQAPDFAESALPRLTSADRLETAMDRLRQAISEAVTADRQVEEWQNRPELRRAFAEMHVNPVAFANLMLRISCAWSAWTIHKETSLAEARSQLELRTAQLVARIQHPAIPAGSREQRELLANLEEMIAMTEFLRLLEQVPAESLQAVAAAQSELRPVLPESSLAREFTQYVESQSTILRASYQTR